MKLSPADVLTMLGMATIVAGVAMWSVQAAIVLLGLFVCSIGLVLARHEQAVKQHGAAHGNDVNTVRSTRGS